MRLFVAVVPPRDALAHLDEILSGHRTRVGSPRWTAPELRHLTLAFLGEVGEQRVPALTTGLGGVAAGAAALRLRLSGAGVFPPRGAPRVLWVGLDGDPGDLDGLHRLAGAVARAVRQARVPVERRPFRPHLTLGRWRPGDHCDHGLVEDLADYVGPGFGVDRIELIRSHLGPSPRYESLGSWSLGDGGGEPDG